MYDSNLKVARVGGKGFFFRLIIEILSNDNFPNTTKPVQMCRLVEEGSRVESLEKKVIFYN